MTEIELARYTAIVDSILTHGSFKRASIAAACSETHIYRKLSASKELERRGDKSDLYFEHMGRDAWFHQHCQNAKQANAYSQLFSAHEMARIGRTEPIYDMQGYRVQAKVDRFLHLSDSEIVAIANFEDPLAPNPPNPARLRYEFNPDGTPVYLERQVPIGQALHSTILKGILPGTFDRPSHLTVDSVQRISVLTIPAEKWTPPVRQPPLEVGYLPTIDDVRAERLAEANEHLARTDRTTKPDGPVTVFGRPEPTPPLHGDRDSVAARPDRPPDPTPPQPPPRYVLPEAPEPEPEPPLPSYVRRPRTVDDARREHDARPVCTPSHPGARVAGGRVGDPANGRIIR